VECIYLTPCWALEPFSIPPRLDVLVLRHRVMLQKQIGNDSERHPMIGNLG